MLSVGIHSAVGRIFLVVLLLIKCLARSSQFQEPDWPILAQTFHFCFHWAFTLQRYASDDVTVTSHIRRPILDRENCRTQFWPLYIASLTTISVGNVFWFWGQTSNALLAACCRLKRLLHVHMYVFLKLSIPVVQSTNVTHTALDSGVLQDTCAMHKCRHAHCVG